MPETQFSVAGPVELFSHQKEARDFARMAKKAYLALDCGMGKTLTSVAAVPDGESALVIAEVNEVVNSQNFRREVETHIPGARYVSLREVELRDVPAGRVFAAANVECLAKIGPGPLIERFPHLIIDEATLAKTTTTARFKAVLRMCRLAKSVTLLSGTPMMNGAAEIYAPLLLMGHWLAGDGSAKCRQAFEAVFAGGFMKKIRNTGIYFRDYQWWAKGANNVRELRWLIRDRFHFKSKEETGAFRKKARTMVDVPMSAEWRREYDAAWDEYLAGLKEHNRTAARGDRRSIKNATELRQVIENGQVYQVNSKWKAMHAAEVVRDHRIIYPKDRIIVWTMFIETDRLLQEELARLGVAFRKFDDLAEWKEKGIGVLVGRIGSHAKGGNVPEACMSLFVDMHYVPAMNLQAENRMDRPEQTQDMAVMYLQTAEETVDWHVRKVNQDKMRKVREFTRPWEPGEEEAIRPEVAALLGNRRKEFQALARASGFDLGRLYL